MGLCRGAIGSRIFDFGLSRPYLADYRRRVLAPARGEVLEIGFGSGINLAYYPDRINALVAVEPDRALIARSAGRRRSFRKRMTVIEAVGEVLPFSCERFDTVVSTLTLCSVDDPGRVLSEIRRVLRPGGSFLYLEHGRANEAGVARWQDRLDRVWTRMPCGCHLNRDMSALIEAADFGLVDMVEDYMPRTPRWVGLMTEGRAVR